MRDRGSVGGLGHVRRIWGFRGSLGIDAGYTYRPVRRSRVLRLGR